MTCLAATSDGRTLASGSRDTTIMLWEANPTYVKGEGAVHHGGMSWECHGDVMWPHGCPHGIIMDVMG
mgnify:CR=1 FL=1